MIDYDQQSPIFGKQSVYRISWLGVPKDDTGQPLPFTLYSDRSVQVTGTFGGASVTIEGSNDGENWFTLADPQGNSLNFVTAKLEAILELVLWIRPKVTGGDGTTSINVNMCVKA